MCLQLLDSGHASPLGRIAVVGGVHAINNVRESEVLLFCVFGSTPA